MNGLGRVKQNRPPEEVNPQRTSLFVAKTIGETTLSADSNLGANQSSLKYDWQLHGVPPQSHLVGRRWQVLQPHRFGAATKAGSARSPRNRQRGLGAGVQRLFKGQWMRLWCRFLTMPSSAAGLKVCPPDASGRLTPSRMRVGRYWPASLRKAPCKKSPIAGF